MLTWQAGRVGLSLHSVDHSTNGDQPLRQDDLELHCAAVVRMDGDGADT